MSDSDRTLEMTFAFVDLAGYTALTEAHGARTAADCVDRFVDWTKAALGPVGRLIDCIGDAVFVMLPTPTDGIRVVGQLFTIAARESEFPVLRAGLHHGEALERNGLLFGTAINMAARVAAHAQGGQALGTALVADAARREGIAVSAIGAIHLRNIRNPVELFDLQLVPNAGEIDPIDPVCRMRLPRARAAGHLRFQETEYWFCSLECAGAFAAQPDAYVRS